MADNSIVQGLFGIDPTTYQMQMQANQEAQAGRFAQLSGAEQGQYGAFRGGQMVGNIGATLMGGKDPMLAKATELKQLASQFDTTNPAGLRQLATALVQAGYPEQAQMAVSAAQKMLESQATITAKTREQLSPVAKAQGDRSRLLQAGYSANSPEVQELTKYIAAEGQGRAPQVSLDLKMLDMAGGRRTTFMNENKPLIEQGTAIQQALTLARQDTAFSEAALENSLASAFGGDKQKSKQEVNRLLNTGSLDERIKNSVSKFVTGKTGDMTQEDRINVLEAVQGDIKRKYDKRRDATIKSASGVKELAGQENYMAPDFLETVGGGAYAGTPAVSVGQTASTKKYGVVTYTKVNPAGQPTEFKDAKGQTYTLEGTK
jgi:hypothetical protein